MEDFPDLAAAKTNILLKNSRYRLRLESEKVNMSLEYSGDGLYKAKFSDTKVPGVYNVDFDIRGHREGLGNFSRKETRTHVLKFGKIDLIQSRLRFLEAIPDLDIPYRVYIRPKDEFGNLLGPGYAHWIKVTSASDVGYPIDHLDGSYTVPIQGIPDGRDVKIKIEIMDETIFSGSIADIKQRLFICFRKHLKNITYIQKDTQTVKE